MRDRASNFVGGRAACLRFTVGGGGGGSVRAAAAVLTGSWLGACTLFRPVPPGLSLFAPSGSLAFSSLPTPTHLYAILLMERRRSLRSNLASLVDASILFLSITSVLWPFGH